MHLTKDEIRDDILSFQDRIKLNQVKLTELPKGIVCFAEDKKRKKARRDLEHEISHFEKIIEVARESLS
jgi:hypothetical protein